MKGNSRVLKSLNTMLADELTAIGQYMVHSEMCNNWQYGRLHKAIEQRAIQEMKHAEKLIARILFLEGAPVVSHLNEIRIGPDVDKQFAIDREAEVGAVAAYNAAIKQAAELGDNGTRELFESILKDEEDHLDWIEAQLDQIRQIGTQMYLAEQIRE